jgi:ABC-type bacteriocin/lantibiotic exporter with double-glycine peptidase domain
LLRNNSKEREDAVVGYKGLQEHRILLFCFTVITFLLASTSCRTAETLPVSSALKVIRDVPFYPQETYQCGPSSLASVLNYWDIPVTPDTIAEEIFSKAARGTLTMDMILYAQKKGLHAEQYKGTIENLKHSIHEGYPVIVLVDYGFSFYQQNHFMVIVGYAEQGIVAHTGRSKEKVIPWDDFVKVWGKTGYWTTLIKKKVKGE